MEAESYPERVHARIVKVTKPILINFLTLLIIPLWPLFFIFISPFLVYRFLVSKVAHFLDPNLGSMIRGISSLMSAHTPYSRPFNIVVLAIYLDNPIEKTRLVSLVNERIFEKGMYPELKQEIITRFGFHFWRNLEPSDFSLNNHIRLYNGKEENSENGNENNAEISQAEVLQFVGYLSKLPFQPKRSPWEAIIINNYRDPSKPSAKSVIIFRAHHCFIDAYSIINILRKLVSFAPKMSVEPIQTPKLGLGKRFLLSLSYIVSYPHELFKYGLNGDVNPWVEPSAKSASGKVNVYESAPIEIAKLKALKNSLGVSMTCLLNTIFIGGVQGLMKTKHQIWREFRLHMPIMLLEDSSDKLENHFVGISLNMKVFDNSIYDTLRHINKELHDVALSPQVSGFRNVTKLIGSFPVKLQPHPSRFPGATTLLSNIPGTLEKIELDGLGRVEDFNAIVTPVDNVGIMAMAISYCGSTKFTIAADSMVLSDANDKEAFSTGVADALNQLLAAKAKVIQFDE
ncbi:unnamed protein product [Orchesella dallaii]|uniref:O-acyltransferase WSD1 C-terminal domain-containing protein n=1 Tax=Orchesella dallaii TaxID=48710 RepID=A0ABP1RJG3_9HEXA